MAIIVELDEKDIQELLTKVKSITISPNTPEETITLEEVKSTKRGRRKMTAEERVEKLNAYAREYYRKNRDKCLENQKEYNNDKHRELLRKHCHENKEYIKEHKKKQYREKNKEIISQKAKERYARMKEQKNRL